MPNVDNVDFRKLRAFHLVVKHGGLRQAALHLNQTLPAVSLKVRSLEQELGVQLFRRLPNRLILTAEGESFAREVEAIFSKVQSAIATLRPGSLLKGRLSVSINGDLAWYLAPRISAFIKRHPSIDLGIYTYKAADALLLLDRGELDLAIGFFPRLPKKFGKELIAQSDFCLACPPKHPLLKRQAFRLEDIQRYRLIMLPRPYSTRQLVETGLTRAGIKVSNTMEVGNCQTACEFVQRGIGIAIIHSICSRQNLAGKVSIIDLRQHFGKTDIFAVYRRDKKPSPSLLSMLEELTTPD